MALLDILPTNWFLYLSLIAASLVLRWYLYYTDTPHIRGLAEIPGWPLLGSLVTLGDTHAKQFALWSKQHGPVYQVRLGTKVGPFCFNYDYVKLMNLCKEGRRCKHIRKCEEAMDQQSISPRLSSHVPYLSFRGV